MTTNEILSSVFSQFEGATLCRKGNSTFIAVPTGFINEDGVQTYASVKVSALLAKDTKTNKAFDLASASAEYEAYQARQAEKAAKPKAEKKGADPAKQEAKQKRMEKALEWLSENPGEHTCLEVKEAMPEVYGDITIMQVGSDLKSLWEEGRITRRTEKSKHFYAK